MDRIPGVFVASDAARNNMIKLGFTVCVVALCVTTAFAQPGDKKGEQQVSRVPAEKIPPAPPLSAADELKTFKVPAGFRVELVASEPLAEVPIAMQFDPDGRIYVVEMRGFMPNADAVGEKEPVGRVSVLEDTNGDGRMDKRTTFLDGLVMPRAVSLVQGGVLVAEPPHLWFCRDTNADLKCDEKIEVTGDYGSQANPEHTANGLLSARDNWIYSANWNFRLRNTRGKWQKEPTTGRGQWGISQDDFGRLFHNSNSDQLRADFVPSHYGSKRGAGTKIAGLNVQVVKDQSTWPGRVNPGVNRGYQPKQLRADGTLATVTAACGPCIYRGENFPSEFYGNAFVCEPSGNLVKRNVLTEQDGVISGKNAYDKAEFLTSTDERFRPVNLYTGLDGALYVVDMYHGILQHRVYVTSYLRQQIEARGLDKPQNQGRIWRVFHDKTPLAKTPKLANASSAELVNFLSHANGSVRDTAQRLLVERNDSTVVPTLQQLAMNSPKPLARLHALWALEGMAKLDAVSVTKALQDEHSKVRAAALRMSEPLLRTNAPAQLRAKVLSLRNDKAADVQVQLALTLGELADESETKAALLTLSQSPVKLASDAAKFSIAAHQPVKTAPVAATKAPSLSVEDEKQFVAGKVMYEATCGACHQPHGLGQEGLAPPLAGSEWVAGSEARLIRIVLHGVRGPMKVKAQKYELDMPALGVLEDQQVADVLTYVRKEWGHTFAPVKADSVKNVRAQLKNREDAWTQDELLKLR
jgi:glucose/arabinose dehydrogenase/mono/diheme cytochrome c family protein